MVTCALLQADAYGINIVEEIKLRMDRDVNLSAVHITLYRLEDKGYVKSRVGGATAQRGGRRKRIFQLTQAGISLLKDTQQKRQALWNLVPELN
ncbi:MAG: PadR family transcriptional regulator [Roseivirga sp.]|nr:PadR family transcriptional regulator [Roseivirga sp.]